MSMFHFTNSQISFLQFCFCLDFACNSPSLSFHIKKCSILNVSHNSTVFNTLRAGLFKLFKHPFPGLLTILTL